MKSFRTFEIPLRDKESGFIERYSLDDIGINPDNIHSFGYIRWYGKHLPPKNTIEPIDDSWADSVRYIHFVTPNEITEYELCAEITLWDTSADVILKLQSLPDVKEVATNMHHLSYILKGRLGRNENVDRVLKAIAEL